MSESRLKIGLGQLDMVWEEKEANRKKGKKDGSGSFRARS